jgi:hypothetical protein
MFVIITPGKSKLKSSDWDVNTGIWIILEGGGRNSFYVASLLNGRTAVEENPVRAVVDIQDFNHAHLKLFPNVISVQSLSPLIVCA